MSPYQSLGYFTLLGYLIVPTMALGWLGRLPRWWVLALTAVAVCVQYGALADEAVPLLGFLALQMAMALVFLRWRRRSRRAVWVAVAVAMVPMLWAKLSGAAFLGLSYVTIRCLDVLLGIQDGLIESLDARVYLAYILFFPTLAAGPIDRYRRFADDLRATRSAAQFAADADQAVHWLYQGLIYKLVLATLVQKYWLSTALGKVSYMYAYTLFLYFDFAGYSALALAVSLLLGVHTPPNFNRPFMATNIREFWNRWHISLSWWLRDHVYTRFLMAALRRGWFGSEQVASAVGYLLAFGLMGAWHGLTAGFLLFGFYHAVLMIGYDWLSRQQRWRSLWEGGRWRLAGMVLTFHAFAFSMLLFSGRMFAVPSNGHLESVTCEGVRGWAWDSSHPRQSVHVELSWRKKKWVLLADAPHADVGNHGFYLPLPDFFKDGWPYRLNARILESGAVLEPLTFVCGDLDLRGYRAAVSTADVETVRGYAEDTGDPTASTAVEVWIDGAHVGQVEARGDFQYALPPTVRDGRAHVIRLAVAGVELTNSPQRVRRP